MALSDYYAPTQAEFPAFSVNRIPQVCFGPGRLRAIGNAGKPVVLVVDAALRQLGVAARVVSDLEGAGAEVHVFADVAGEPKQAQIDAATNFVRTANAGLVICLGGGSAMDIGKVAATVAMTGDRPIDFAMDGKPLPRKSIPKICVPTTAGTGSELSATNIFADRRGRKVWVWGAETKPDRVILDPELTLTLPPQPTAWTGLDAFAHALESCTNTRRHPANDLFAHAALGLICGALEAAVNQPRNLAARSRMLLGSAYAGIAIDNCGAGMAHNISHALAVLGRVPHGLATGLGLETVLGWQAATDNGPFAAAAAACGLGRDAGALTQMYTDLMTRCGVARRLPEAFKASSAADLAAEMRADETRYMRDSSVRRVSDANIERFAASVMALA